MFRIGQARDIHQLELQSLNNRKMILGTIEIPFEKGIVAHSDGDCLVHAIVDAIIGALGLGDIGKMFPDTSPTYKNISSVYFLNEIKKILKSNKYQIVNIDSTIIIEKPILRPYIDQMRNNIASILEIDINDINIKATRGEKLGYIGEGLGVEAEAIVLLESSSKIRRL